MLRVSKLALLHLPISKLGIWNPGSLATYTQLRVMLPFLCLFSLPCRDKSNKSMFTIPLYTFPLLSANYLSVQQPCQEVSPFYTCCKYVVSVHSCQIKSPWSTLSVFATLLSGACQHFSLTFADYYYSRRLGQRSAWQSLCVRSPSCS